jgi:CRP/FNR family cyclic AMP-dependent transcriptional regulator
MPPLPKTPRIPEKIPQTLANIDLFAMADATLRRSYEQRCIWQWWNTHAAIIDRDGQGDEVYFVVHGTVRVMNYSASGHREVALDEIAAGGYFGEMAAIDGEPRSAHIIAAGRTLTARLPGAVFLDYLKSNPAAALIMMRRLTEIVRSSSARILDLSTLAAQNRIYGDLLRHAKTGGAGTANAATVKPAPRHQTIAARTSTTRETVARVLGDLARRGLVVREGGALVIKDLAALNRMVDKLRA